MSLTTLIKKNEEGLPNIWGNSQIFPHIFFISVCCLRAMPFLEGEEEGVGYLLADGLEQGSQGGGVGRGAAEADKQERLGGPQPLVGGPVRRHAQHGGLPGAARSVHHVRTSGRPFKTAKSKSTQNQCCGSGSVIRCIFDPWTRIPNPYFLELSDKFLGKSSIILWKLGQIFFFSISKIK